MSRLLFQGVCGEPDLSESFRINSLVTEHRPLTTFREADKLREECGVVAIYGHPHAAREAYLALYALQHRGQESAGIATADGAHLANIKGMGLVSEIFTDDVLAKLPGTLPLATRVIPPPATPRCSMRSPFASTPQRVSSPSRTTATWSILAISAPVSSATGPTSRPPPTPRSSSSSSLIPARTRSSTPSRTHSRRSMARSPSS